MDKVTLHYLGGGGKPVEMEVDVDGLMFIHVHNDDYSLRVSDAPITESQRGIYISVHGELHIIPRASNAILLRGKLDL